MDVSQDVHPFAVALNPYREIGECRLTLDFSTTRFLSPPAIAVLAAFRADAQLRGVEVDLNLTGARETLRRYLDRIGFVGNNLVPESDYAIPLQHISTLDDSLIGDYLLNRWLDKSPFSEEQRRFVASAVGELFVNVFNHSESEIGLVTCGQYFPSLRALQLVIVDMGISIPASVRVRFLRNMGYFKAHDALSWAFERGNSRLATSRGLGLAILKSLIEKNGSLKIHSGAASGIIGMGTSFMGRGDHFAGTLVDLTIRNVDVKHAPKVVF